MSIGNTMGHGGPRHYVLILSFEDASDDVYNALHENNINAVKDVGSIGWSEYLDPTAVRAIEESRISIIVFSYEFCAYPPSRLDELVMILDRMKTKGKLVLSIFDGVNPLDVRHLITRWGAGMQMPEKLENWNLALSEVAYIPGWSLEKGYVSTLKSEQGF
ncbi:disease resistance protein RUN1-like [Prosopis cineraria]|uniref:disease resistance protein RUN1-like n=1 Tax=Prosopis cineraria TaxID=364024 RepID=UPI00240F61AF|nr:disease resistance protein RUN1-like [Prosopis cineraria]